MNKDEGADDFLEDSGEGLYIIEGLQSSADEEEQQAHLFTLQESELDASESLEPASEEMGAVELNLGVDESVENTGFSEELEESQESEEELATTGSSKLYLWGSIAAGVLCLLSFGAWWMKSKEKPLNFPAIASAPQMTAVETPATPLVSSVPTPEEPAQIEAQSGEPVQVLEPTESEVAQFPSPNLDPMVEEPLVSEIGVPQPEPSANPLISTEAESSLQIVSLSSGAGEAEATALPEAPANPPSAEPTAEGTGEGSEQLVLRRGDGILQLKNGNLFPVKVMKITEQGVVCRVPEGDLYFEISQIAKLLPPAGKGNYEAYPDGFVQLNNGNRLWGKILDQNEKSITIASAAAKIVIPQDTVIEVKIGHGIEVKGSAK